MGSSSEEWSVRGGTRRAAGRRRRTEKELAGLEESTLAGILTKEDHLLEGYCWRRGRVSK